MTTTFKSNNLNIVEFLKTSVDMGFISIAQAVEMGNMVEMVSLETVEKAPNPQRVVNANSVKWESISGVPVVDCKSYSHWSIMNTEAARQLVESEVSKQRTAGFSPAKVVFQGYRIIVRLESKSHVTSKYKNMVHGKLQKSPFKGLQWQYSNKECGFYIDLNDPKFK